MRKNVKDKGAAPTIDEDLIEEETNNNNSPDKGVKIKKMSIKFSWDHMNQYSAILEEDEGNFSSSLYFALSIHHSQF